MRERAAEVGGEVAVERRPEGGTRVFARLPLGPGDDVTGWPPTPIRVLIADDHAAFRGGLRALLATADDLERRRRGGDRRRRRSRRRGGDSRTSC